MMVPIWICSTGWMSIWDGPRWTQLCLHPYPTTALSKLTIVKLPSLEALTLGIFGIFWPFGLSFSISDSFFAILSFYHLIIFFCKTLNVLHYYLTNVRFMSYLKCSNWGRISNLLSNYGCLFTFCYLDVAMQFNQNCLTYRMVVSSNAHYYSGIFTVCRDWKSPS